MDLRKKILIVEDDEDIALSLKYNFEREGGYVVEVAPTGERGLELASRGFDLVILDLTLPDMDGLSVCTALRRGRGPADVPVIMLTARVEESDKIVGLEIGADDYVTKPFSIKELVARARALLRRAEARGSAPEDRAVYADDALRLDPAARELRVHGRPVELTRKEFDLLAALIAGRGRVLTREQLLQKVWGYEYFGETRTVDVHVRRLRKKLGAAAQERIETIIGVGYRFRAGTP
jgi:two-component system alkaline phosphatase synthesis response regulator PhoP